MSDLVAIAYDNLDAAQQVAANASQAQKAHLIAPRGHGRRRAPPDGKVKLHQPSLAGQRRGQRRPLGRPDRADLLRPVLRHGDRRGERKPPPGRSPITASTTAS